MKGRALRRALASSDALRVNADIPAITDTTELITPAVAQEMLRRNTNNRPINWVKVEEYAQVMRDGKWELHAQGLVLDVHDNILTGQKRLWAIIYADCNVYMRVSRGNPASAARLIDRGVPQSSRDLAARESGRKHSPTEASIARAYCACMGNVHPSVDVLAECLSVNATVVEEILAQTKGAKKTRATLMILGAICAVAATPAEAATLAEMTSLFSEQLEVALQPHTAAECWGKGASFGLAMKDAYRIVRRER